MTNCAFSCCRRLVQHRRRAALILARPTEVVGIEFFLFLNTLPVSALGTKIQGTVLKRPSWAAAAVSCLLTPHPRQLPVLCSLLPHPSAPTASETDIQVVSLTDHTFTHCLRLLAKAESHQCGGGSRCFSSSWSDLLLQKSSLVFFYLIYNLKHDLHVKPFFIHKPSS